MRPIKDFKMQPALISHAATLLDDPIMMEWAIYHYKELPPNSATREQLENLWFDDITIQRWLDTGDARVVSLMFLYLPEHRFASLTPSIARQWGAWPSQLADSAARIMVRLAPDLAAETFTQYMANARPASFEKSIAILTNLDQLPAERALPMLEEMLPLAWGDDKLLSGSFHHFAVEAAAKLKPGILPRLLDQLFAGNEDRFENEISSMAHSLLGHDTYAELFFSLRNGYEVTCFADLFMLFETAAPLEEMDAVAQSDTPAHDAMQLLKSHYAKSPAATLVWETIRQSEIGYKKNPPAALAALALAGVAATFELKQLATEAMSIENALVYISLDVSTNIHYDALLQRLRSFPQEEVTLAMSEEFETIMDNYGGIAVARLMGDMGRAEFVQPLIDSLNENAGSYLCEAVQQALLNIGEPARDALIAQWDELDFSQKIFGLSVMAGMGGQAAADFAVSRFEELFHEDIEQWCSLAEAAPDLRMIELLQPETRRKQPLIDKTYYKLCRLLDVQAEDLSDIRERIVKNHARQEKATENILGGDWVSDRNTMHLALRCTVCGETNGYDVKGVVVDDDGKNPQVADEFPCLSCGALADFELGKGAYFSIMAENLRVLGAREAEDDVKPLVSMKSINHAGETIPLSTALARLREKTNHDPHDWLSQFRLGNLLFDINRLHAALDCYQKAYAGNPLLLELVINLSETLIRLGEKPQAFELLHRTLQNQGNWQTVTSNPAERGREFAHQFNRLRHELGRNDTPSLHPNFYAAQQKVGRNDPCPCGSGKKYKKCCIG